MGFLPDFRHDIFVSYAHVDNIPWHGVQDGWVTTLIANIRTELATLLGRTDAYSLWMDDKLAKDVELTPQIIEALNNTAILVIILSPGYLASDWCSREKSTFFNVIRNRKPRVLVIERSLVEIDERPAEIGDFVSFQFWVKEHNGRYQKTLGDPELIKGDSHYYTYIDRVKEVSYTLKKTLNELKKSGTINKDRVDQTKKISVFLADTTDDLDQTRRSVSNYLKQFDIQVIPESCYTLEPSSFRLHTEQDMQECRAFVQLLSGWSGKKPADLPQGYLQLQYDCALKSGIPIFQWRNPTLDLTTIEDDDHRTLVNGDQVRAESIEEFKRAIKEYALKPPPEIPARINEQPFVGSTLQNSFVFVNCTMDKNLTEDRNLATKVGKELCRHGYSYVLSPVCGTPKDIRNQIKKSLLNCIGIIIIYGCSTSEWVSSQVVDIFSKLSQFKKKINAFAICEGPPEEKNELTVGVPNMLLLDMKNGIDETRLNHEITKFIDTLAKENV